MEVFFERLAKRSILVFVTIFIVSLAIGTFLPVCFFNFISSDVYIFVGKQVDQFTIYILTEFHCRFFSGADG